MVVVAVRANVSKSFLHSSLVHNKPVEVMRLRMRHASEAVAL